MQSPTESPFSGSQFSAVMGFGCVAILITGLQPIILGALINSNILNLEEAGIVAMAEIVGLGIGVTLASLLFPLDRVRLIGLVATVGLVVANLASAWTGGVGGLLSARVAAGLLSGVVIWIVTGTIVRMPVPERRSAIFLFSHTLAQAVMAGILALFVLDSYGWQGAFVAMAIATALAVPFFRQLPPSFAAIAAPTEAMPRFSRPVLLVAVVTFCQLALITAIWAFLEPIGEVASISTDTLQLTVAITLLFQVVGAMLAAATAPKLPALPTIMVVVVLQAALAVYFSSVAGSSTTVFVAVSFLFGFLWLFVMPFQVKLAFDADPRGDLASMLPSLQLLGSAAGPLTAGVYIGTGSATAAGTVSIVFGAFTFLALIGVGLVRAGVDLQPSPTPTNGVRPAE